MPSTPTPRTICRVSSSPTIFSESDSDADNTRAEFIRAQCAGAHADALALFTAHAWRWADLDAPTKLTKLGAETVITSFERGFATRLRLNSGCLGSVASLRRLLVREPVTEVLFEVGVGSSASTVDVRTLLPFSHPVSMKVVRQGRREYGFQDAFLSALLSSPLVASVTTLELNALTAWRSGTSLVAWLARSPFLCRVRNLNLAQNFLTGREARVLARAPQLRNVTYLNATGNLFDVAGSDELAMRFGNGLVI